MVGTESALSLHLQVFQEHLEFLQDAGGVHYLELVFSILLIQRRAGKEHQGEGAQVTGVHLVYRSGGVQCVLIAHSVAAEAEQHDDRHVDAGVLGLSHRLDHLPGGRALVHPFEYLVVSALKSYVTDAQLLGAKSGKLLGALGQDVTGVGVDAHPLQGGEVLVQAVQDPLQLVGG